VPSPYATTTFGPISWIPLKNSAPPPWNTSVHDKPPSVVRIINPLAVAIKATLASYATILEVLPETLAPVVKVLPASVDTNE